MKLKNHPLGLLALCAMIGLFPLFFEPPVEITKTTWSLFAIFLFNLSALILRPLPAGASSIIALTLAILTGTLSFDKAAMGFGSEVIWLILSAFFFARGFIKTGLGFRLGYHLMALFGKSTLGIGYSVALTDLLMAPGIPSNTARNGAIVYPVVLSMARAYGGEKSQTLRRFGLFLTQVSFQSGIITSAMFLTSMAANPLIADFALRFGVHLDWTTWFKAAFVPGMISLAVIPWVLLYLINPEIRKTADAGEIAKSHLAKMGPMKFQEKALLTIFVLLVMLWIFGKALFGWNATFVALLGLSLLLFAGSIEWEDVLHEKGAWDTFIWFSVILSLTGSLAEMGFFKVITDHLAAKLSFSHPVLTLVAITVTYYYSHYFFASLIAHIAAMYLPFLALAVALGVPAAPAALVLGFCSSLFGGLTHYGCASAPIFFGAGYASVSEWWKCGAVVSLCHLLIWGIFGSLWWKWIGLF